MAGFFGCNPGKRFVYLGRQFVTVNHQMEALNFQCYGVQDIKPSIGQAKQLLANFIAGKVSTKGYFSYGIYECNATFANKNGSFPAFWLYNDYMCDETARTEIDIVELKRNFISSTIDNTDLVLSVELFAG